MNLMWAFLLAHAFYQGDYMLRHPKFNLGIINFPFHFIWGFRKVQILYSGATQVLHRYYPGASHVIHRFFTSASGAIQVLPRYYPGASQGLQIVRCPRCFLIARQTSYIIFGAVIR